MYQITSAVSYLHRRGILHRNLKPKHLLVRPGPVAADPLGKGCALMGLTVSVLALPALITQCLCICATEGAVVQLADFALVRTLTTPPKNLTSEVGVRSVQLFVCAPTK